MTPRSGADAGTTSRCSPRTATWRARWSRSGGFARTSSGFVGTSDGWTDLAGDHDARLRLRPRARRQRAADRRDPARRRRDDELHARARLRRLDRGGRADRPRRPARILRPHRSGLSRGWHAYLRSLKPAPRRALARAAHPVRRRGDDGQGARRQDLRGAFIASLTLPWGFAVNADEGGGGYHFVWARDLYQQVSSLLAAGDRAAADAAVTWLFTRQQLADGTFPQTSRVDGTPDDAHHPARPDRLPDHPRLAARADRRRHLAGHPQGRRRARHARPDDAAGALGGDRRLLQLDAAGDDRRPGHGVRPRPPARRHDSAPRSGWASRTRGSAAWRQWLFTTNGPLRRRPLLHPHRRRRRPERRLGARLRQRRRRAQGGRGRRRRLPRARAPRRQGAGRSRTSRASLPETDASLATDTPSGRVWHRYTFDGYGEKADGSPWALNTPGTKGRAWPLLSGERGEYEIANGRSGLPYLRTMANTANDGYMIPEQVWDEPEPAPAPYGYQPGKATGAASPLAWAMAQYVRLARAIAAGRPVETPRRRGPAATPTGAQRDGAGARAHRAAGRRAWPTGARSPCAGRPTPRRCTVGVGGDVVTAAVSRRHLRARPCRSQRGGNQITVVAEGEDGGTDMRQVDRRLVRHPHRRASPTPRATTTGPAPTSIRPTRPSPRAASTSPALDVFTDGDDALFVATIAGEVRNPWGGDEISHQRFNVYLGAGDGRSAAGAAGDQPGHGRPVETPPSSATAASAPPALFGPDGAPARRRASCSPCPRRARSPSSCRAPRSAGWISATARYGVAMFGNGESGEGIGYIRPVYDCDYWNNPPSGIRLGQGVPLRRRRGRDRLRAPQQGHRHPRPERDRRDRRAAARPRRTVLDWRLGAPVRLPMLPLPG